MHFSTALLTLLPLAAASPAAVKRTEPAPVITRSDAFNFGDHYIVKFRDGSPMSVIQDVLTHLPFEPFHIFSNIFSGFAAVLDPAAVEMLKYLPDVEYIEQDSHGSGSGQLVGQVHQISSEEDAPWGLGRISHRKKGSTEYNFDPNSGQGVCAYVIDSGIDDTHPEFEGRAQQIKSFISGADTDDLGHGTHCAGTIGSKSYGVSKKVSLFGVKVLDKWNSYKFSDLLAAWDYVVEDSPKRDCPNGVVISVSLTGKRSDIINQSAANMVQKGYFMSVASGNNNEDADEHSPGSERSVCTVGGSDRNDKRYEHSNFGPGVDIVGPAVDILSTLPGGYSAEYTGTSMAAPHIAGIAAYMATRDGVKVNPSFCQQMVDVATKNAITNQTPNTVNLIAYRD